MEQIANPRIVITGMGAITPIGTDVETYWRNLLNGKCGIHPITRYDASKTETRLAGEIYDFDPLAYLPKKLSSRMALFTRYGYGAATQALQDSGLVIENPNRVGIVLGTALGGTADIAAEQLRLEEAGEKGTPTFIPKILSNIASSQIAIGHGLRGPNYTLSTACASGDDAVGLSAMLLRSGAADVMLAVGCEAVTCPIVVSSLSAARVLVSGENPAAASPFDKNRSGFVLGEGGGALVLETEAHARCRGAKIYGELLGYGNNNDGYHITTPRENGEGGADCMRMALQSAGLQPWEIDYINGHGTGTIVGDALECAAMQTVFGKQLSQIPVSSLRGATGHMMAAGSITDSIACLLAIRDQILPPTLHYETPDPSCPIDCVPNVARPYSVKIAMNNAFGFGGQNASLIFGQYPS